MTAFTVHNHFLKNSTLIENDFIDFHMQNANGDYVKVYLLLLRHQNQPNASLTIAGIADCLEMTEGDVMRAIRYWEKQKLLTLKRNADGQITKLEIGKTKEPPPYKEGDSSATAAFAPQNQETPADSSGQKEATSSSEQEKSVLNLFSYKNKKEYQDLLYMTECYMGRPLTKTEIDTIHFFHTDLHFPTDLVEYLIEYCVDQGHKSIHYIKAVAIAWAEKNITTLAQAKADCAAQSGYNKLCNRILRAYGIVGRVAVPTEVAYIRRWSEDFGFSEELLEEACKRTMEAIHQPRFEYTEKILMGWKTHGVASLSDIPEAQKAYQEQLAAKQQKRKAISDSEKKNYEKAKRLEKSIAATSRFNNFETHYYDNIGQLERELLEKKLLNTN